MEIETGVPLSRLTTIGTGGPAAALARPATLAELEEAVAWAAERGMDVVTIGLGSNVLAADEGVDALVLRLEGELASVSIDGDLLAAGGGATNAVCLHRARSAGLGGLEFACAIPGTAGGGVRMNAGAYGSDWAAILDRALVVSSAGSGWLEAARARALVPALVARAGTGRRAGRVPADAEADRTRSRPRSPTSSRAARRRSRPTSGRSARSSRTRPARSAPAG